jgi:hypothetical protein
VEVIGKTVDEDDAIDGSSRDEAKAKFLLKVATKS